MDDDAIMVYGSSGNSRINRSRSLSHQSDLVYSMDILNRNAKPKISPMINKKRSANLLHKDNIDENEFLNIEIDQCLENDQFISKSTSVIENELQMGESEIIFKKPLCGNNTDFILNEMDDKPIDSKISSPRTDESIEEYNIRKQEARKKLFITHCETFYTNQELILKNLERLVARQRLTQQRSNDSTYMDSIDNELQLIDVQQKLIQRSNHFLIDMRCSNFWSVAILCASIVIYIGICIN
ncbi:hypothetical protein RDWZM_007840 [Blomia tropicalis]|uniref:Uncharacterized protein n=1 Tax=Blomia tropicalis TaxID=40697 RepID=A0A9Q0RIC1_BLOTA|nr:hypothetical protein RDWZM_007840 [Blomia tropicalis]